MEIPPMAAENTTPAQNWRSPLNPSRVYGCYAGGLDGEVIMLPPTEHLVRRGHDIMSAWGSASYLLKIAKLDTALAISI
jgi:hypothetical protein